MAKGYGKNAVASYDLNRLLFNLPSIHRVASLCLSSPTSTTVRVSVWTWSTASPH